LRGQDILARLREELRQTNEYILNHPLVLEAERGKLSINILKALVINQLYIVPHDLKALSFILSRSRYPDEIEFFKILVDGDYRALHALRKLAEELNVTLDLERIVPEAVTYTHYLSWLALNASLGEAAVAMIVNLPVWGSNTARLARALRNIYDVKAVNFFELFSGPYEELEKMSYPIIERYLDMERYRFVVRMIQTYERMFWDGIYKLKA